MPQTLDQTYETCAGDMKNITRIVAAIGRVGTAILSEDDTTQNHTDRLSWARKALASAENMAKVMVWGVMGDAGVQVDPTDEAYIAAVDRLAYVFANV